MQYYGIVAPDFFMERRAYCHPFSEGWYAGACAGFFYGLPEMPIEDISFDNVSVHMDADGKPDVPAMIDNLEPMKRKGIYLNNVKNASFNNVQITNHEGKAFTIENCEGIKVTNSTE